MSKREDYISWDEYLMGIALLSAQRSKDPGTQVGACIVDRKTNRILSVAITAFPLAAQTMNFPGSVTGSFWILNILMLYMLN